MKKFLIISGGILFFLLLIFTVALCQESNNIDSREIDLHERSEIENSDDLENKNNSEHGKNTKSIKLSIFIPRAKLLQISASVEAEFSYDYSDYLDFAVIVGGYYGSRLDTTIPVNAGFTKIRLLPVYYMGGVKFYPTKKHVYLGFFAGGNTTFLGSNSKISESPLLEKDMDIYFCSGLSCKATAGLEIDGFVFEASYLFLNNDKIIKMLNNKSLIIDDLNGVQVMTGYKW